MVRWGTRGSMEHYSLLLHLWRACQLTRWNRCGHLLLLLCLLLPLLQLLLL